MCLNSVATPVSVRLLADLWNLDLNTPENPDGVHSTAELNKALSDVRAGVFSLPDPATRWYHRRLAQDAATLLTETTEIQIHDVLRENYQVSWAENVVRALPFVGTKTRKNLFRQGSLRWYGRHVIAQLLRAGKSIREVSDICWLNAASGTAVAVGMVSRDIYSLPFDITPDSISLPRFCNSFS